jgi:Right handed beta helix region
MLGRAHRDVPILLAVVLAVAYALTGSASAGSLGCGSVLTTNTVLTTDLQACPGDGLIVAADAVKIDLAGHTIGGTGQGAGIRISSSGVVVRNGTVEGFVSGIRTNDAPASIGTRLLNLMVRGNAGPGIVFFGRGETLERSQIMSNGGDGVLLAGSDQTTVARNKVFRNGLVGIDARPHADGASYAWNDVSDNGQDGIASLDSTARSIVGNTADRNGGDGIDVRDEPGFAAFYLLAGNVADDNAGHGITACIVNFLSGNLCEGGFIDAGGNVARRNRTDPQCINIRCSWARAQGPADGAPSVPAPTEQHRS